MENPEKVPESEESPGKKLLDQSDAVAQIIADIKSLLIELNGLEINGQGIHREGDCFGMLIRGLQYVAKDLRVKALLFYGDERDPASPRTRLPLPVSIIKEPT